MTNRWKFCTAAMLVVAVVLASDAWAKRRGPRFPQPDPQQLADRCMEQVAAMADRCAGHNQKVADCCVAKIAELLEADLVEEADAVAAHCIRHVNRSSDMCVKIIGCSCRCCVRILERLEQPELIEQVNAACEKATAQVRQSQEDAVAAIEAALPVAPPE